MGYKRPVTVYRLQFEGHEGLEVRAASVPLGKLLEMQGQATRLRNGDAESFEDARELFDLFARSIRSWNLEEDDGTPIPVSRESLLGLEFGFAVELLLAWFEAISDVPDPLARRSTGGQQSVGLPTLGLPMEGSSGSLPS